MYKYRCFSKGLQSIAEALYSLCAVMIRKAVIDFSAFVGENKKVIIKELSVLDLDSNCAQHWIFKPPKESGEEVPAGIQRDCGAWSHAVVLDGHNRWLSKHYHGIGFGAGSADYGSLTSALKDICCSVKILYTASCEKAKVLEQLLDNNRVVFSLELLGCPPLSSDTILLPPVDVSTKDRKECLFHHMYAPGFYCTQTNVHILADWCVNNPEKIDVNDPAVREKTFVDWKIKSPSARDLADNGFVRMLSMKDNTKCVYCGVNLIKWEEGDDPIEDHLYASPFCSLMLYKRQEKDKSGEKSKNRGDITATAGQDVTGRYVLSLDVTQEELVSMCKA